MGLLLVAGMAVSARAGVRGDYLEVRSADVFAGACYANSEVGMMGKEATLAWKVRAGSWKGVDLGGLGVVAVVKANATLGDPHHDPFPAKAVLILDERASAAQRQALTAFARSMAGPLVENIVRVEIAAINLEVGDGHHNAQARLIAGQLARIDTRAIGNGDHLCGNEFVYYPPLTETTHAMPAFTMEDVFTGQGLEMNWRRADKRSAFVGTFAQ
jgi:hypothetical protein